MDRKIFKEMEEEFKIHNGYMRTKEVREAGYSYWYLDQLKKDKTVKEIKRGLYRWNKGNFEIVPSMIDASKIVPKGIFCMWTALNHYNLTTYSHPVYFIAINRNHARPTLPKHPKIKLKYFSGKSLNTGVVTVNINGHDIQMFNREKTICDFLRLKEISMHRLKEALYLYSRNDPDFPKLMDYAETFHVEKIIRMFLLFYRKEN